MRFSWEFLLARTFTSHWVLDTTWGVSREITGKGYSYNPWLHLLVVYFTLGPWRPPWRHLCWLTSKGPTALLVFWNAHGQASCHFQPWGLICCINNTSMSWHLDILQEDWQCLTLIGSPLYLPEVCHKIWDSCISWIWARLFHQEELEPQPCYQRQWW